MVSYTNNLGSENRFFYDEYEPNFKQSSSSIQNVLTDMSLSATTSHEASVLEDLKSKIETIFSVPIVSVRWEFDKTYFINYFEMTLDMDARDALKFWLKVIPFMKSLNIKLPIFVRWTGKMNVTAAEFGKYVGKAFSLMNISVRTVEPLDSVKIVKTFRGEKV